MSLTRRSATGLFVVASAALLAVEAWIAGVGKPTTEDPQADGYLNATVSGDPRHVLHLREPVEVAGLFGRTRHARTIGISVDDESRFLGELNRHLS